MKLAARIIAGLILLLFFFVSLPKPALAQYNTNNYFSVNSEPDVPKDITTLSFAISNGVISWANCQLTGIDPVSPTHKCLGINMSNGKIGYVQGGSGLIGATTGLIANLYVFPVHTADYVKYMAGNFGFTKPAYAEAAIGFVQLNPLIKAWTAFRDIVYVLFVIFFVVIGLGIMLRLQLDPRTVMSIQNQIPKIIITLILITFSYAIAGLLIDLMWIVILLMLGLFSQADPGKINIPEIVGNLGNSPFGFLGGIFSSWFGGYGLAKIAGNATLSVSDIISNMFAPSTTAKVLLGILTLGAAPLAMLLIEAIAFLVISIAITISLFRLWFMLIKSYIQILIAVILAPFWILVGLWPFGKLSVRFGTWIRSLLGNLSTFIIVIGLFLLGKVILDVFDGTGTQFVPPLIGSQNADAFRGIIALGIILLAPNAAKYAQEIFKGTEFDTKPISGAIGAGAGVPIAAGKTTAATYFGRQTPRQTGNVAASGMPEYTRGGVTGALRGLLKI